MSYKAYIIDITEPQLKQALRGKKVRFTNAQLGRGDKKLWLHPAQGKKVEQAVIKNSGVDIVFSDGELAETYERIREGGAGFFSDAWKELKRAWGPVILPALKSAATAALDTGAAALGAHSGRPDLVNVGRQGVKKLTGLGLARSAPRRSKKDRDDLLKASGLFLSN